MKYGITIMLSMALVALVTMPLHATADDGHAHWDDSKRSEFFEKRQNALHDKLELTAAQEPAWKDFVTSIKPDEHRTKHDWSELSKLSTPDRLDRMLTIMKDRQQALESRVKPIKVFYDQLTVEQKKTFDESFHALWRGHRWHHGYENRCHREDPHGQERN